MTMSHDFSLATSLTMLKEMIIRALEEQDEEPVPTHSREVVDRMTADYKDHSVRRVFK